MKSKFGLLAVFLITGSISLGLWWINRGERPGDGHLISPVGMVVAPTPDLREARLIEALKTEVASASGTYAVYVYELKRNHSYGFNEQTVMTGASIMKVPAIVSVLRQVQERKISLEDKVALLESDRRLGAGPLQYQPAGKTFSYQQLISEMGEKSDNTAWVMVNRILGREYISQTMTQLGMVQSSYAEIDTTAADVGTMFVSLYRNKIPGSEWKTIAPYLTNSIYEDRISVGVPTGIPVVHKVGTLEDAWMDAGVVESENPFVLVVMNTGVRITPAQAIVPKLVSLVWKYEQSL